MKTGEGKEKGKTGKKLQSTSTCNFAFFCFLLASNDFYNAYAASSRKLRGGSGSNKTVCTRVLGGE